MAPHEVYCFGAFTLDVAERRLTNVSEQIPLEPKTFDLLVALVRHGGHLVEKRELLDAVWGGAFVEEGILAVHVSRLRAALGDDRRTPDCIETVTGAGYRFKAALTRIAGQPAIPGPAAVDYERVGRGRFHLLSASRNEVPLAVDAYQAAIAHDPTYAAAHAGLALAHCAEAEMRLSPPQIAYAAAKTAALRALALNGTSADAQVALGVVMFLSDWNWTAAERCFRRALELNPDHTEAYLLLGRVLEAIGLVEAALATKLRALEREPHSPIVHMQIALTYWNQRSYDNVVEWANKTLALDPQHLLAREYLAGAYLKKEELDRYLVECEAHAQAAGSPKAVMDPYRKHYEAGSRVGALEELLGRVASGECHLPEMQLAIISGEVGDLDRAFSHLNAAIDSRDPCLVHLAVAPQWDPLRHDVRFSACLSRMGLSPQAI
jgi:DNA-binding winged helix-turn-helix (wHTH) protein